MFPELGTIGSLTFYSFGLMAALALVVPGWFMSEDLRQRGMNPARAFELVIAAAVGGFVGARVYFVIENPSSGTGLLSGSGLVWYGGVIGGVIAVVALALWRRLPLGVVANLTAPALALGYAIGRIGCQLAGDGDYGKVSTLPWAMSYPDGTVPTVRLVQPTPLYETASMLFVFWLLWRLRGRLMQPWSLFGLWCVLAGLERFLVEFVRRNPEEALGLTTAQITSIALVAVGVALLARTGALRPGLPPRPAART
jgi:phosphatidylglycerol:prolipoprotein diacylglycerol transferase